MSYIKKINNFSSYDENTKITEDIYDKDTLLSDVLVNFHPGFEFPDWDGRSIKEFKDAVSKNVTQLEIEEMSDQDGDMVPHSYAPELPAVFGLYIRYKDPDGDRLAKWISDSDSHEEALAEAHAVAQCFNLSIRGEASDRQIDRELLSNLHTLSNALTDTPIDPSMNFEQVKQWLAESIAVHIRQVEIRGSLSNEFEPDLVFIVVARLMDAACNSYTKDIGHYSDRDEAIKQADSLAEFFDLPIIDRTRDLILRRSHELSLS